MKYLLTETKKDYENHVLTRIVHKRDDKDIYGGWVESLFNVGQDSQIGQDAFLMDNARVNESYIGYTDDQTPDDLFIFNKPYETEKPTIIKDLAFVEMKSIVKNESVLTDQVRVRKSVVDNCKLSDEVFVNASYLEKCEITGKAQIFNSGLEKCKITGDVNIAAATMIHADIKKQTDFIIFSVPKSEKEYQWDVSKFNYNKDSEILPARGRILCFYKASPCLDNNYIDGAILACSSDPTLVTSIDRVEELADTRELEDLYRALAKKSMEYIK